MPTTKDDAQTCCRANGAGSRLANAHIENAGAACTPISASMEVRIMTPVHAPPAAEGPGETSWITPGTAT